MPRRGIVGLLALIATLLLGQGLAFGASNISGKVTDSAGNPLANICVEAQAPILGGVSNAGARTGADGKYTITDLFTHDDYRIYFRNCGTGNFAPEYYSNSSTLAGATPVSAAVDGRTTTNINAELDPGGSITGLVTGEGATPSPLAGVCVEALDGGGQVISTATTASAGTYELKNLPAGSVDVRFARCGSYTGNRVGEYYDNVQEVGAASSVPVSSTAPAENVNAQLPVEGEITGQVTALQGGGTLSGICVEALDTGGNAVGDDGVKTDSFGNYRIGGLLTGAYKVRFSDCRVSGALYLEQYYGGDTEATAAPVDVESGQADLDIDAQMRRTATIAGTVTAEEGGAAVPGLCVGVYDETSDLVAVEETDGNGSYLIDGIQPGGYRIGFLTAGLGGGSCASVPFLTEYYDGVPGDAADAIDLASAPLQQLDADENMTGVHATLKQGGAITGLVTDAGANNLMGICAEAYDVNGEVVASGESDMTGTYRIEALRDGFYRVGFRDCDTGHYLNEFYNDETFAGADQVDVDNGQTTELLPAELGNAGVIKGRVSSVSGPLAGICVTVSDQLGAQVDQVTTDADGNYLVPSLPAATYTVYFDDCGGSDYRGEYYDDTLDPGLASPLEVTASLSDTIANATLARGGSITGTVTNAENAPLEDVCVRATELDGSAVMARSDAQGFYSVDGLDGEYTLRFSDCSGEGYLSHSRTESVPVGFDQVSSGVNAVLTRGGSISGTVTAAAGGEALPEICVEATGPSGTVSAVTDAAGTYTIKGLLGGEYTVAFVDCGQGIYHGASYGSPLSVTVDNNIPDVNAQLSVSGSISGTVTNSLAGQALRGVCVDAYDSTDALVSSAITDSAGSYVVRRLETGSYRLEFTPCSAGDYTPEFYANETLLENATPIAVDDGENTGPIDTVMSSPDDVPPETTISTGPDALINHRGPEFAFTAEPGATFECKLDGGPDGLSGDFFACNAPGSHSYNNLEDGTYLFSVVATDPVGNRDSTPATREFTVDATAPQITITGPSGLINNISPSFTLASNEPGSSFECVLRAPGTFGDNLVPCLSSSYSGLADGQYTFEARAVDPAGNQGATAAKTFTIDTQAPNTSVSGTSGVVENGSASFTISGDSGTVRYECRLQMLGVFAGFTSCPTQKSYSNLGVGQWTFEARAIDAAGNADPTPATRSFIVQDPDDPDPDPDPVDPVDPADPGEDVTPPETTLTQTPKKTIKTKKKSVKAAFFFTSSEPGGFECSLDDSDFSPCTSPFKTKVKKGRHRFAVRAIDEADNVDPTPAKFAFRVKRKR